MRKIPYFLLILLINSGRAESVDVFSWNGTTDDLWSTAANWTPSGGGTAPPDVANDVAQFIGITQTIDIDPTFIIGELTISGNSDLIFTSSTPGGAIITSTGGPSSGDFFLVDSNLFLDDTSGGIGVAGNTFINGSGSTVFLDVESNMGVRNFEVGTTADSEVNIDIEDGNDIVGKGRILTGNIAAADTRLGVNASSEVTLDIKEGGTFWTNVMGGVTRLGVNPVDIEGRVMTTVEVQGDWIADGDVYVGDEGTATVSLLVGADDQGFWDVNGNLFIAANAGAVGTVEVSGAGTLLDASGGDVEVGGAFSNGGTATLTISDGGEMIVGSVFKAYTPEAGRSRTVTLLGSTSRLTVDVLDLDISNGGLPMNISGSILPDHFNWVSGTFTITDTFNAVDSDEFAKSGEQLVFTNPSQILNLDGHLFMVADHAITLASGAEWTFGNLIGTGENFTLAAGTLTLTDAFATLRIGDSAPIGGTFVFDGLRTVNLPSNGEVQIEKNGQVIIAETLVELPFVSVEQDGILRVQQGLLDIVSAGGALNNLGEVVLEDRDNARIEAEFINNSGVIRGSGRIDGELINTNAGEIRLINDDVMAFTADGVFPRNLGRITLTGSASAAPPQLTFQSKLVNDPDGIINTFGPTILRFNNDLENQGAITATLAQTQIFGDVDVTVGGQVVTVANSTLIFHEDVDNEGTFSTGANSVVVFLGSLSGSGSFFGSGTIQAFGDTRPGSSPGLQSFGGDLELFGSGTTEIEIGGLDRATGAFMTGDLTYDAIDVAGEFNIFGTSRVLKILPFVEGGGMLDLSIFDAGAMLKIIRFGSWNGTEFGSFDMSMFPALSGGRMWELVYDATGTFLDNGMGGEDEGFGGAIFLKLVAIPEPGTYLTLSTALAVVAFQRRRSRGWNQTD